MARITNRNFLADFATLDIEYGPDQRGPDVSNDIQMVYIMGDVTGGAVAVSAFTPPWDEPPTIRNQYGFHTFVGNVAAQRGRLEILALAAGGGIWITSVYSITNGIVDVQFFTLGAFTGLGTTVTPTAANSAAYGSGAAATAIIEHGTSLATAPLNAERHDIGEGTQGAGEFLTGNGLAGVYIGPGRVFVMQHFTVNVPEFFGLNWIEIP